MLLLAQAGTKTDLGITSEERISGEDYQDAICLFAAQMSHFGESADPGKLPIFGGFFCRLCSQFAETRAGGWSALHWDD